MFNAATDLMLVFSSPAADVSDEEFDDWYDNVHAPEILASIEGVEAVHRFRRHPDATPPGVATHPRLAIYELSAPSDVVQQRMASRKRSSDVSRLDVVDNPPVILRYEAISKRITATDDVPLA